MRSRLRGLMSSRIPSRLGVPLKYQMWLTGLASEMRIALKLLTSSMVLLRAAVWLGGAMRYVSERRRVRQGATPRVSDQGQVQRQDDQSSNPARLIPPRSGSR